MNKRERVLQAIAGQPVDRPPVCFWRHYGKVTPQQTVRGHLQFFQDTGMDILKMMCDEFFTYPMQWPMTDAEILSLRPLGRESDYIRGQAQRAAQINEQLQGEAFTLYNAFSPFTTLKHTIGDAECMAFLREREAAALHLLDVICEDTCYLVEEILTQSGTDGMMLPLQGAEQGRFTAEEYARLVAPTERRVIECADRLSSANLLHLCGWDGTPNHLEWWADYPASMVNWAVYVENLDLAAGRARFPGRTLMGGFDNRPGTLLHTGSKEAIKAETKRIVTEAGTNGIILGADCSIPSDTDPAHIRWVIEALEEMAR